uniref:Uncharacterized protein n=1 Tax=Zea mays TaxID=4577 RepID=A0A804RAK0_MAIZE
MSRDRKQACIVETDSQVMQVEEEQIEPLREQVAALCNFLRLPREYSQLACSYAYYFLNIVSSMRHA